MLFKMNRLIYIYVFFVMISMLQCRQSVSNNATNTSVVIDRFSINSVLFNRSVFPSLPSANMPINFTQPPFYAVGLDSIGNSVGFYNLDMWSNSADSVYVIVAYNKLDSILDMVFPKIPGQVGYNDFKAVVLIQAPAGYQRGNVKSYTTLLTGINNLQFNYIGYTQLVLNLPIVPNYSILPSTIIDTGWYNNQQVIAFQLPDSLYAPPQGVIPFNNIDSIYLTFKQNPTITTVLNPYTSDTLASFINNVGYYVVPNTNQTHVIIRRTNVGQSNIYSSLRAPIVYDTNNFYSTINWKATQLFAFYRYVFLIGRNATYANPITLYMNTPTTYAIATHRNRLQQMIQSFLLNRNKV